MMSLTLSSWLWFYHHFIFHFLSWSYINLESCRLLPRHASHYWKVMAFMSCWLIIIIHCLIDGLDVDCFPPLEACITLSGTMKVSNQVGGFQVRFDLRVSCPCTQSELCHQRYGLSFYLWKAALTIANKVLECLGQPWPITQKRILPICCIGLLDCPKLMDQALPAQMRKFHLSYICICIYQLTYIIICICR